MKLSIVAFLQNPWFPPGTDKELIYAYKTKQEVHRKLLKETMTGYRLHQAFGSLYDEIHWDNVAPEAVDHPKKTSPVDMQHVEGIISVLRPNLILTFGEVARQAIESSIAAIKTKTMACHHPNARYRFQADLDYFAQQVWDYKLLMERKDEFTKDL